MKQAILLFCTLFFASSYSQNPFFKKGNRPKSYLTNTALRTSGNIVVLVDSMTYESKDGFERSIIEYTDFGFIGIKEEKDIDAEVWSKNELIFYYINSIGKADSFLVYEKDNETGDWKNYIEYKYIYEYDVNENEISELNQTNYDNTILIDDTKRLSFYNNNDLLDSTITYYQTNNQWVERYYNQY